MIELICPSKGRPDKLKRMWNSARQTAGNPDALHLRLGINEEEADLYAPYVDGNVSMYGVRDWSTVHTHNVLAVEAMKGSGRLFVMIGDDTIFATPLWDKALVEHYQALKSKIHVYAFLDSRSPEGTPHPIATREYIEAVGYFATPIFLHWYVDHWMAEMAKANHCFTHLKDYLLVHDKPSDHGKPDHTHMRIRERGWHERDKYVSHVCEDFLDAEKLRLAEAIGRHVKEAA